MMSIARSILAAAVCLTALALPAAAQQRMPPGPAPQGDRPTDEQREEIRKKMEAIRIVRLTEELKLDEKTAARFFPLITALDQKRRTLLRENQDILQEVRTIMSAPSPDESRLKAAINRIEKNHHEMMSLRDKEMDAIKRNLTVQQQARYLLFHQEFQREMRGMVEGVRGSAPGRRGMPPGPGRGPHGLPPEER